MPDEEFPEDPHLYWNKRQKKSFIPAAVGLAILCLVLAYLLSRTAH